MKKKQQEIVIKIQDSEALKKYLSTDYNKIVCLNVFDKFWGPVEVLDSQIKKFLEFKDNSTKTDFISCDKELTADLFTKYTFSSKPKFFVLHQGNIVSFIDGLDYPKLTEEIEKSLTLLDA